MRGLDSEVTMLAEQITTAIRTATLVQTDNLAKQAWSAWGEGHLTDADAEAISRATEERRAALRSGRVPNHRSQFLSSSKHRRSVSPDRRKSIGRRRTLAASGAVPGRLACHFTQGEVAALTVVAREVKRKGRCELPIDAIAAMAGVCRTVVKNALREAQRLRLVSVTERPRPGRRSDTNLIAVVSSEWQTWLRLGRDRGQKPETHGIHKLDSGEITADRHGRSSSVLAYLNQPEILIRQRKKEGK